MLKYSEERHSKQGTKRERIIFAPQLLHYINLTWLQSYSVIHSHKLLGLTLSGWAGISLCSWAPAPTWVPTDSTAAPKWKAKCGLEERRDQPLHTHSPGLLLMRSVGTGTDCSSQTKSDSVNKALLSLSLILGNLLNLFKKPNSILIPCVPGKENAAKAQGFFGGFFGWWDFGLGERDGIKIRRAERQEVFKILNV